MTVTAAFFSGARSSIRLSPMPVESAVEMPEATQVQTMLMTNVIGMKMLTAESASLPTRLPTTTPSTVDRSSVARLVAIMKGR